MSRRRHLSEEERALWTGVVRSIKPLRRAPKPPPETAAPSVSVEAVAALPRPAARHEASPEKKSPPLAPLGRRLRQRVARGRESIDGRIDLHGLTQSEAHGALLRFLRNAQSDGAKTVLIVTGKGRGGGEPEAAPQRGVLKRQVPLLLSRPEFRVFVIGFDDAHAGHGGQGALYVRLRRGR
jgi:DNA-nicking Smr family endonuclease